MTQDELQAGGEEDRWRRERELMVRQQILERGISSARLLEAMLAVPRHRFVPKDFVAQAYDDRPVHIGSGQTISQPYMVALMTDSLELAGTEKVLDVGTGSGYQAAILAEMTSHVHTVERIGDLSRDAERRLESLGYDNVTFHVGDGSTGLAREAPYDAILVAAAAQKVPESLKSQLSPGGRLAIPVGEPSSQVLMLIEKTAKGFETSEICPCIFVKLIGVEGYKR